MPRYSRLLANYVLLFTVPSVALYPQSNFHTAPTQSREIREMPLQIGPLLSSYDNILDLIDDLEDEELEKKYNQADLKRINYFLARLAMQGILPNEEEEFILKDDIQELLYGEEDLYQYSFLLGQENNYVFIPNVFHGQEKIVLCKSWIQKKWEQTKKFVKKHKKAIII